MKLVFLLCLIAPPFLRAQLLSEALHTFPANTASLEYDDLKTLRRLPNYRALRSEYSSAALEQLKNSLLQLRVSEDQVSAVVTASSPDAFFGLLTGNFDLATARSGAARGNFSRVAMGEGTAFCSRRDVCIFVPAHAAENAAFGPLAQLRRMLDVRQGHARALASVSLVSTLLNAMDLHAPVIGLAPGSEVGQLIGDADSQHLLTRLNLLQWFSKIQTFGYSMRVDTRAHVAVHFQCGSDTESALLCRTLNLAGSLQNTVGSSLPFQNIQAVPSGRMVALTLNARLGS